MKITVSLKKPSQQGSFAEILLSFTDAEGIRRHVKMDIDFQGLYDFSQETNSTAFDFFLVSTLVYGIDNLLSRYQYSIDAWTREIEVSFPVNNIKSWRRVRNNLQSLLNFLTGDYWSVSFKKTDIGAFFRTNKKRRKSNIPRYNKTSYSFASLFSGGLDSLVGVIDSLEQLKGKSRGLLISHFDPTSPGPSIDQKRLSDFLSQQPQYQNRFDYVQGCVALSSNDTKGRNLTKESSYRSRSFLFIGIAIYLLQSAERCNILLIPENGTISLNYPLTPSRSGSLSTRTAHPYYLSEFQKLLSQIGIGIQLVNPYELQTKGEVVAGCRNHNVLSGIYVQSVSCAKRGRKMNWDSRSGTNHCGVCMPCVYRRAALHALNLDNQLYGIDIFSTEKNIFTIEGMPALFDFLNQKLSRDQIMRKLLVNGSLNLDSIDAYAQVIERTRSELKQWIKDKGNKTLRRLAGCT